MIVRIAPTNTYSEEENANCTEPETTCRCLHVLGAVCALVASVGDQSLGTDI